jgi:hypothetical protein
MTMRVADAGESLAKADIAISEREVLGIFDVRETPGSSR